jgi:hypothetical protein
VSEVLAGFVCGYALALISTPLVALAMMRMRSQVPVLAIAVPERVPLAALTVVLFWFTFLFWTLIGLVFGLILSGFEDRVPQGGLGSPNLAFTLLVVLWSAVAFAPVAVLLRAARRYVAAAALVFLGVFGWLMPYLAEWSPIASS